MTDRAFRRQCARRCSSHSCGLTTRVIKTKAAAASARRSRATLRARMAATSRLAIRRKADYGQPYACWSEQGFLFSLRIAGGAGEDVHQAFCAIRVRFQPAVDARGGLADGCKGPPPAADAFAERSQAVEDDIGEIAVLLEIGAAVVGDRVKPRGVGGRGQIARFRK